MKKKTQILIASAACVAVIAAIAIWKVEVPYRQWESRDGTLQIIVKKQWIASCLPVMPGQGGDAPGSVLVREKRTGRVLLKKRIPMVNTAEDELGDFRERCVEPAGGVYGLSEAAKPSTHP